MKNIQIPNKMGSILDESFLPLSQPTYGDLSRIFKTRDFRGELPFSTSA